MRLHAAADYSGSASGRFDCISMNGLEVNKLPSRSIKVYLHPGKVFVSSESATVTTILGSCVSACLWDREKKIGGINHYLLPYGPIDVPSVTRYGNGAMELLLRKVLDLGSNKRDLEAKLFGGACVIEAFAGNKNHLGLKNVQVAHRFLSNEGIPLSARTLESGKVVSLSSTSRTERSGSKH